jgi:DoxX
MNIGKLARQAGPETTANAIALIRLAVGGVFLVEGILKFLYRNELAVGRFAKIGIPDPQLMGPFVGGVEAVGGALVLIGLFTRLAAIPHRHHRGHHLDQVARSAGARGLAHRATEAGTLRFLEHGPRGPHRLHDVARLGLSPHCRARAAVHRFVHGRQFVSRKCLVVSTCATLCSPVA